MQSESTEITIAIIAASVLFLVFAGFIISFLFFYNQKKRTHHQELKDQQKRIENEAFRSEMEIRENTLRHVAEEIHDNVGQIMLLAKLNLNKYLIANPGSDVEETRNIVGEAIQELRGLTKMLNANQIISMNLVSVIERELIRLKKTGLVETTFNVEGEDSEIDSSKKLILFRMIQEILQNIMKHSKSTKVGINLIYDEKYLYLNIEDNGIGFNPNELLNKKNSDIGSGLSNLQNRAKVMLADVSIDSKVNEGTRVNIRIPL